MAEMKQRTVHVSYKRVVGDGNFGSEAAEVGLEWFIDEDNNSSMDLEFAQEMLANARDLVLDHLHQSLNANVRRAVTRSIAPARTAPTAQADDELPF